ncbi:hypothetical protein NB703_001491 [Pantoea ananatis]|uniref:Ead/Ea22-like family protein n=1 Tax=Pantoea ananas TaxID=553 RepID=A0AAJ1CXG1_PANAN|nr:ead/Ea22-like family protein [Pantoea ananatis]MCW0343398.1 hypothetical protein [Pantoea ananatis]
MKNQFSGLSGKELVAAGHHFAKSLDADAPLIEIAKMFAEMATRLDCALARGDELQQKLDAMAAENAVMKSAIAGFAKIKQDFDDFDGDRRGIAERLCEAEDALVSCIKTPATDTYLNSVRTEGIHFAANRMLAAWECGFINDTPEQVHDISGAVLSALEFLPNASPEEFKRDYADEVRASIAEQLRSGTHDTADKAGEA